MYKTLNLHIDRASWATVLPPYRRRCPFPAGQTHTRISFPHALLWIGITSVPIRIPRWWLASQWALLRYFAAANHQETTLCLHEAVDDLEKHHKQVLSDDWGVGFALQWLCSRMRYRQLGHGSFVIADLQDAGLAKFSKRSKNGAAKCPDFIALAPNGRFHLIECKGNQKGPNETLNQFVNGRKQKRNIRFRHEKLVGQRILTGISIAAAGSRWASTLRVEDPPPENENSIEVHEINVETARPINDSLQKAAVIRGLLSAGAYDLAHKAFAKETETIDVRTLQRPRLSEFNSKDTAWIGQEYELVYPVALRAQDGSEFRGARMRYGVAADLVRRATVQDAERLRTFLLEAETDLSHDDLVIETGRDSEPLQRHAIIQQGSSFIAEMEIL